LQTKLEDIGPFNATFVQFKIEAGCLMKQATIVKQVDECIEENLLEDIAIM
jgi:hypothetical protein